ETMLRPAPLLITCALTNMIATDVSTSSGHVATATYIAPSNRSACQGRCRFCRRTLAYLTDFFQVVCLTESLIETEGMLDGKVFPAGEGFSSHPSCTTEQFAESADVNTSDCSG
ncbi:hypothetical protein, partial [Rhizobium leguminosarum]|uniref:hypothetical protein n=1 Tax=Rhizobium leguminosarum TaxID=384 RepID=UPI001C95DCC0